MFYQSVLSRKTNAGHIAMADAIATIARNTCASEECVPLIRAVRDEREEFNRVDDYCNPFTAKLKEAVDVLRYIAQSVYSWCKAKAQTAEDEEAKTALAHLGHVYELSILGRTLTETEALVVFSEFLGSVSEHPLKAEADDAVAAANAFFSEKMAYEAARVAKKTAEVRAATDLAIYNLFVALEFYAIFGAGEGGAQSAWADRDAVHKVARRFVRKKSNFSESNLDIPNDSASEEEEEQESEENQSQTEEGQSQENQSQTEGN